MRLSRRAWLIALFGCLHAFTYAGLLPLWEGFDEPFHFGYVQHLASTGSLPQLGITSLSREVRTSIELAPASHVVRSNISGSMAYDEFYALSAEQREDRLKLLRAIDTSLRFKGSASPNYQAHHPPLAFALLAPLEKGLARVPLVHRVLLLRWTAGIVSVALTTVFALWLAHEIGLTGVWALALLLCAFSSQMFYATVTHVCNDWLAVPLVTGWLAAACTHVKRGSLRSACLLGLITSLGLLTKAYFLALVPVLAVALIRPLMRSRSFGPAAVCLAITLTSAPWYWRNVKLYGNISGTVEATNGVGPAKVLEAAASVPWVSSIAYMARASVWTGNNSFTNFSVFTIHTYLLLLLCLFVLYCVRHARAKQIDLLVLLTVAVFSGGIWFATVSSYVFTQGRSAGASPWYMQPLLVPVLTLCLLGAQASGRAGSFVAASLIGLSTYILSATYFAKLIPLYNGFPGGKVTLASMLSWYSQTAAEGATSLSLLPGGVVGAMALLLTFAGVGLAFFVIRDIVGVPGSPGTAASGRNSVQ